MDNEQYVTPKIIHHALKAWQLPSGTPETLLSTLLLVQDAQAAPPLLPRHATNSVLLNAIDALAKQSATKADILRMRFADGATAEAVAVQLDYTPDTIFRQQREAIDALSSIINQWERERRAAKLIELEADLQPATYNRLFGTDDVQNELARLLLNDDGDWVIGVVGMGGMGKTAVTDSTIRHLLPSFRFARILWVRMEPDGANGRFLSPQHAHDTLLTSISQRLWPQAHANLSHRERLTKLHQLFNQQPCLLVVDNLEEPADTAYIVEQMSRLTAPSKLLITSRARPETAVGFPLLTLGELNEADAIALMRHHAHDKGIQFVETATADDLHAIYQTVGGNPYAVKLVVGLLDVWPLTDLLRQLERGGDGSPQALYTHIYHQTWRSLSENARLLLLAMPLVADSGGSVEQLQSITNLGDQFWTAVSELHRRSLIEVRGNLQEKRYGIHRLTYTFLSTEIIGWEGEG